MRSLTTHVLWIDVPVRNLLGNIYNKAYRSILGVIMMSNDGRIDFIVVPDKKYFGLLLKILHQWFHSSHFKFHVLRKKHRDESSTPARYNLRVTSQAWWKQKKKLSARTMLVAVSLRYSVVFAYICINIDFTIFKKQNKWNNCLSHIWQHNNTHIIYVSSVCSCNIIRKYVYFYIRWRSSRISPFWTFSRPLKKCNSFFSWSSWYFGSGWSEKSILTDKTNESVIWDIWAYTI